MGGGLIRRSLAPALLGLCLLGASPAAAAPFQIDEQQGPVHARVSGGEAVLGNGLVERRWALAPFRTASLTDLRGTDRVWSANHRDFALGIAGIEVGSESFNVDEADVDALPRGGLRLELTLHPPALPLVTVTRAIEAYPGVAGLRTETTVSSSIPLALRSAVLDEAAVGAAAPTIHAFRGGADWREPEWAGPAITVGDPHAGTWRDSRDAGTGESLAAPGEWISVRDEDQRRAFIVMERNDFPSSRMSYEGGVARAVVDHSRDVIDFGPFEENIHVENPIPIGVGRVRLVRPGEPMALAPVFTGFATGSDDEPWQFHRFLTEQRTAPYPHAVTFNTNNIDSNRISTGAKDDVDFETVQELAPIARRLGIETFILDDGWQARSGDWQPDSPQFPEPRWDGDPGSKFAPRFPDPTFDAVRGAIAPMDLGLWMSPTFFNPSAQAFAQHPEWSCQPLATPLVALNLLQPDDGSNEAGLGPWSQDALGHVEARIRNAIENWGVVYFKFDFLAWFDCLSASGLVRDMYDMHDAFVAMLDRLRESYPGVTLQIDETNDYRLFPFESVARGPSWFQNGGPPPAQMLHNLWNLSPFVPAFSLGQNALANGDFGRYPVDTLMASSLLSHITFFNDIRRLSAPVIERIGEWTSFYREQRSRLDGVVYPLLDDPIAGGWTALQPWDPVAGEGALLAFRQSSGQQSRTVPLRNVSDGTYELISAPGGQRVGSAGAADLRAGLEIEIPEAEGSRVLLIRRLAPDPDPDPDPDPGPGGSGGSGSAGAPGTAAGGAAAGAGAQTTSTGVVTRRRCRKRRRLRGSAGRSGAGRASPSSATRSRRRCRPRRSASRRRAGGG